MKIKQPPFEVGFELEWFIHKGRDVLMARDVLKEELGFSIDQNRQDAGCLDLGGGYKLRTDGTVVELQWFAPYQFGHIPESLDMFSRVNRINVLSKFGRSFSPVLQEGDDRLIYYEKTHFKDPGKTFSSMKIIRNAYTGEENDGVKKEGDKDVTTRTAGLHLHFSICGRSLSETIAGQGEAELEFNKAVFGSRKHTDELIKIADGVYHDIFENSHCWNFSEASKARVDLYQKLGNYRVKFNTITKNPTLEYRQLDSTMTGSRLSQFVSTFQIEAARYLQMI